MESGSGWGRGVGVGGDWGGRVEVGGSEGWSRGDWG